MIDVLVDTNVLLRTQFDKRIHIKNASRALAKLRADGKHLATSTQNLAEFWNTSTRPEDANGYGLSIEETEARFHYFERSLTIVPEPRQSFVYWKALLKKYEIRGKQVHDARLVAVMQAFKVPAILTFNIRHFARFAEIEALHPDHLLEPL